MEVSGVSSQAMSQASSTSDAIGVSVQRKAMDIEKQAAQSLIESLPDPSSMVGQNLDVNA